MQELEKYHHTIIIFHQLPIPTYLKEKTKLIVQASNFQTMRLFTTHLCIKITHPISSTTTTTTNTYNLKFSIHFLASSTPSSTLSTLVPWPIAVGAPGLPPALPPIIGVTAEAHLGPSAPAFLKGYLLIYILAILHSFFFSKRVELGRGGECEKKKNKKHSPH